MRKKFVWLKVAFINISKSTVPDCVPFPIVPSLFVIVEIKIRIKVSLN